MVPPLRLTDSECGRAVPSASTVMCNATVGSPGCRYNSSSDGVKRLSVQFAPPLLRGQGLRVCKCSEKVRADGKRITDGRGIGHIIGDGSDPNWSGSDACSLAPREWRKKTDASWRGADSGANQRRLALCGASAHCSVASATAKSIPHKDHNVAPIGIEPIMVCDLRQPLPSLSVPRVFRRLA